MPYSIADTPSYQLLVVYNFIYLFTIIIYDKLLSYQFCQILCGIFYTEQTAVDQDITMIDVPRLISGIIHVIGITRLINCYDHLTSFIDFQSHRIHTILNTIQKHLQNIFRKTGTSSKWDLLRLS